jgi:AcrR family transcriptional regulator
MHTNTINGSDTRERLLTAAERLFADRGYAGTSVRDVTEAAGANVAAVNYHFGGKKNLYLEVFAARTGEMAEMRRKALESAEGDSPRADLEAVLRAFVGACLRNMLARHEADTLARLVFREMASPGPAFEYLMENIAEPNSRELAEPIRRVAPGLSDEKALLCVVSLMGQLLHFVRARSIIERLCGRNYDEAFVEELCDHVVKFSLDGIGGLS